MDSHEKLLNRANEIGNIAKEFYVSCLVEKALNETESPIESLIYYELLLWRSEFHCEKCAHPVITPQRSIGKYRVDFLVEYKDKKIVIECDGHDFHEKTKEQAKHDKRRDRELTNLGYEILRYTGSEIYERARVVLHDVRMLTDDKYRESYLDNTKV